MGQAAGRRPTYFNRRKTKMIQVPWPGTWFQWTWALIGFFFARAFGKKLDQDIQNGEWFKNLTALERNIIARLLDATHHLWMGMLLMLYFTQADPGFWVGWGWFIDDLPDLPKRFAKYFSYLNGG